MPPEEKKAEAPAAAKPKFANAKGVTGVTDVMKQALAEKYPEAKEFVIVSIGVHEVVAEVDGVPRKAQHKPWATG